MMHNGTCATQAVMTVLASNYGGPATMEIAIYVRFLKWGSPKLSFVLIYASVIILIISYTFVVAFIYARYCIQFACCKWCTVYSVPY